MRLSGHKLTFYNHGRTFPPMPDPTLITQPTIDRLETIAQVMWPERWMRAVRASTGHRRRNRKWYLRRAALNLIRKTLHEQGEL